ncbi:TPA: endonuclease/exonuclease/phosphatase family protein [Streptococcus equi subsp. zooepidemicus]|uniref:endonuclease/exonuclease/phosphatase family protein n=1 Tax=Streptococcus equi TaxID=1336 RepID=UPI001E4E13AB|nr:endonuclease/exonuclease/phosphatase family protein [Streptococcus equi]UFR18861.1 endonuclease/exonuclease/phosphatase family protein [Streptococcus equi subsp. zooepidemicus]HEL0008341.1 endonuclease/exonuclease/phosphatase family protein [Streptococcus equi subsp. zooepidemicus]HEL0115502.1 endonuclease/exonuclease/phosphatase family protein [Streptococcus equi subsp. zooepidemicus]HEL0117492.1 endonuclease/exonuclease/phosphatase family protein [Streptococcus equi subsp. zooepidemicus]H
MTQLTVSTWNINQRSGLGRQIPDMVVTELRQLNADIICLTEYVKTESHNLFCARLQDIGYEVFEDDRSLEFGNEILVTIKSSLISDSKFTTIDNDDSNPNFLRVTVNIFGKELNIVGTRIKTGGKDIIEDFKERKIQLDNLISNLPASHENTIILGDFNNGFFKQNDDIHSYQGKAREFYSYPLLKSIMSKASLTVYTPSDSNSWKYCKLDHIFANIPIVNENYSWEFLKNPDYKSQVGYPDHAILSATISL